MMEEYRAWTQSIHAPEDLKVRVLRSAERQTVRPRQTVKWAACTACVLMLAVFAVWGQRAVETPGGAPQAELLVLTAAAAEPGANGGLVFLDAPAELAGTAVELSAGRRYRLTQEGLRAVTNEDGSRVLVPALAGEEAELTGLYAAPEDGVWFLWPVEGSSTISLSAPYGLRAETGFFHSGMDIPAQQGMAIAAAAAGTVTEAGYTPDRGNYLLIDHGEGLTTLYGHCRELLAAEGDAVAAGETVARVGATGMVTGPHLHFEVRLDGEAQNPVAYFDAGIRAQLHAE